MQPLILYEKLIINNFMQNLDEYLYEQTNAGQEEVAEWREQVRKEREREMDDADRAWSER